MLQEWRLLDPLTLMANPAQPNPQATGMDTDIETGTSMDRGTGTAA